MSATPCSAPVFYRERFLLTIIDLLQRNLSLMAEGWSFAHQARLRIEMLLSRRKLRSVFGVHGEAEDGPRLASGLRDEEPSGCGSDVIWDGEDVATVVK